MLLLPNSDIILDAFVRYARIIYEETCTKSAMTTVPRYGSILLPSLLRREASAEPWHKKCAGNPAYLQTLSTDDRRHLL